MRVVAHPLPEDIADRREIPSGDCAPLPTRRVVTMRTPDGKDVEVLTGDVVGCASVEDDGTVTWWTLSHSDPYEEHGRGAEFAPGGAANVAGIVVVHSGTVTLTAPGHDPIVVARRPNPVNARDDLAPGRWILR